MENISKIIARSTKSIQEDPSFYLYLSCGSVVAFVAIYLAKNWLHNQKQYADARKKRQTQVKYTSPTAEQLPARINALNKAFLSGKTLPLSWRYTQLQQLRNLIVYNKNEIMEAVQKDLGKAVTFEVISSEVNLIVAELDSTVANLKSWSSPERVYTPIAHQPATSEIRKDPLGVVLVISPWNYPVNLALVPFMAAIAAGNCVFLKASRHSANVGKLLSVLIPKYMDMECFEVEHEGGAAMITALIQQKWDHIFFTGSVSVGKIVYEHAAKHLTPVTLELGGKNACIVDDTIDLKFAAKRIAWGKWYNNGQTCIGVDHILVVESVKEMFIKALIQAVKEFYGENPKNSPSYCRIISKDAANRLSKLLKEGRVVYGGDVDIDNKYISPTIMDNVDLNGTIMTDEIFGPVLPIIPVESVEKAVEFVNGRPLPLALYIFSSDKRNQEYVLNRTRSGGVCVNEVLLHFTNHGLPFGGVGASGIGKYHGKFSFDTFVNKRSCIKSVSKNWLDIPFRYAPYTSFKIALVDLFTRIHW